MSVCIAATDALAYSTRAHTAITAFAIRESKLTADPKLIEQLGLGPLLLENRETPFRFRIDNPYIVIGPTPKVLGADAEFEKTIMKDTRTAVGNQYIPTDHTIAGWIMRGAIREDDNSLENPNTDEPGGVFDRVFAHFFDPYNDRGLTIAGAYGIGARATHWAFQEGATSATSVSNPLPRTSIYNLPAAREAMWRALTGMTKDRLDARPPNTAGMESESVRNAYWATVFRTLGDMVHLLQDMAQPQHTRNDAHSGLGCPKLSNNCAGGHDSFYEKYINARVLGNKSFTLEEGLIWASQSPDIDVPADLPNLVYTGYIKPNFNKFEDFFSTGTGEGSLTGRGLANYSNRGFYTFGTNVSAVSIGKYPAPDPRGDGLGSESIPGNELKDMTGKSLPGVMTFRTGTVPDYLTNEHTHNVRLSTAGAWDQFTKKKFFSSNTLNYYNYEAQADLLIKRAVGYSAGLIDHFFRGKMEISLPDEGVYAIADHSLPSVYTKDTGGFRKVKLKIQNQTRDADDNPELMATEDFGQLTAVVKFRRNNCYEPLLLSGQPGGPAHNYVCKRSEEEEIVVSNPVPATAAINSATKQAVSFTFEKAIPINAVDVYLQVVFRGGLGNEKDAVVVATKDISEPTFFTFDNFSDCYRDPNGNYSTVSGWNMTTSLRFNSSEDFIVGVTDQLPGTFSRFAFLSDNYNFAYRALDGYPWFDYIGVDQKHGIPASIENPQIYFHGRPTSQGDRYTRHGYGYYVDTGANVYERMRPCSPVNPRPQPLQVLKFD